LGEESTTARWNNKETGRYQYRHNSSQASQKTLLHNSSKESILKPLDPSKITHETNFLVERMKILEELQRLDVQMKASQSILSQQQQSKGNLRSIKLKKLPLQSSLDAGQNKGATDRSQTFLTGYSDLNLQTTRRDPTQTDRESNTKRSKDNQKADGSPKGNKNLNLNTQIVEEAASPKVKPKKRARNFKVKIFSSKQMFEGYTYSQYDQYVVNDSTMQKVVVRDQLIIIIDKTSMLKYEVFDESLTKKIKRYIEEPVLKVLNRRLEEVLGILNELIKLLLFDILDELDKIFQVKSPIEPIKDEPPRTEADNYQENSRLVKGMLDYFKEGVECYLMLCKQSKSNRVLDDINCSLIIQLVERGRFNISLILETMQAIKLRIVQLVTLTHP
jgi:hypothetical protein